MSGKSDVSAINQISNKQIDNSDKVSTTKDTPNHNQDSVKAKLVMSPHNKDKSIIRKRDNTLTTDLRKTNATNGIDFKFSLNIDFKCTCTLN